MSSMYCAASTSLKTSTKRARLVVVQAAPLDAQAARRHLGPVEDAIGDGPQRRDPLAGASRGPASDLSLSTAKASSTVLRMMRLRFAFLPDRALGRAGDLQRGEHRAIAMRLDRRGLVRRPILAARGRRRSHVEELAPAVQRARRLGQRGHRDVVVEARLHERDRAASTYAVTASATSRTSPKPMP